MLSGSGEPSKEGKSGRLEQEQKCCCVQVLGKESQCNLDEVSQAFFHRRGTGISVNSLVMVKLGGPVTV